MKKALASILILSTLQTFPTPAYALPTSSAVSTSLHSSSIAIVASSINNTEGQDLSDIQQTNFDDLLRQKELDEKNIEKNIFYRETKSCPPKKEE